MGYICADLSMGAEKAPFAPDSDGSIGHDGEIQIKQKASRIRHATHAPFRPRAPRGFDPWLIGQIEGQQLSSYRAEGRGFRREDSEGDVEIKRTQRIQLKREREN